MEDASKGHATPDHPADVREAVANAISNELAYDLGLGFVFTLADRLVKALADEGYEVRKVDGCR